MVPTVSAASSTRARHVKSARAFASSCRLVRLPRPAASPSEPQCKYRATGHAYDVVIHGLDEHPLRVAVVIGSRAGGWWEEGER
ncbi:hypothetical protein VTO73DRAFT_4617 [Trametes versicolor]